MNRFKSQQLYNRYIHVRSILSAGPISTPNGDEYEPREFLSDLYAAALQAGEMEAMKADLADMTRSRDDFVRSSEVSARNNAQLHIDLKKAEEAARCAVQDSERQEQKIEELEHSVRLHHDRVMELSNSAALSRARERIVDLEKKQASAVDALASAQGEIESLKADLIDMTRNRDVLTGLYVDNQEKLDAAEEQIAKLQLRISQSLQEAIHTAKLRGQKIEELKHSVRVHQDQIMNLRMEHGSAQENCKRVERKIEQIKDILK